MKTRKVLRIVLLTLLLAVSALLTFTACSRQLPNDKEIVDVEVFGIPEEGIPVGGFDEANIRVKVTFDDGSTETAQLLESDLPEEYQTLVHIPGDHIFEMLYRGMKITYRVRVYGEFYKVTFVNALDQVVKSINYEVHTGTPEIVPPTAEEMEVPGYRFLGEFDKSWDNITGDTVIKGVYVKTYVVSFYNGLDAEPISTQILNAGEDAVEPSEEDRYVEGYFFKGWDRDFTNVQSDLNVNGFYIRGYMVSYSANDAANGIVSGSVASESYVAPSTIVTVSATPIGDAEFLGWYQGDTCVSMDCDYSFMMLTQNMALVAKFSHEHVDTDPHNHRCDEADCSEVIWTDNNKDHCCDFCGAAFGGHTDANGDSICDYCGKLY